MRVVLGELADTDAGVGGEERGAIGRGFETKARFHSHGRLFQ